MLDDVREGDLEGLFGGHRVVHEAVFAPVFHAGLGQAGLDGGLHVFAVEVGEGLRDFGEALENAAHFLGVHVGGAHIVHAEGQAEAAFHADFILELIGAPGGGRAIGAVSGFLVFEILVKDQCATNQERPQHGHHGPESTSDSCTSSAHDSSPGKLHCRSKGS